MILYAEINGQEVSSAPQLQMLQR